MDPVMPETDITRTLLQLLNDTVAKNTGPYLSPPDLSLYLHLLQPQKYISAPPRRSLVRTSKTQVISMFEHPQAPKRTGLVLLMSNISMASKHQTLKAWRWGYEVAI